jgi:hypothetical protein
VGNVVNNLPIKVEFSFGVGGLGTSSVFVKNTVLSFLVKKAIIIGILVLL